MLAWQMDGEMEKCLMRTAHNMRLVNLILALAGLTCWLTLSGYSRKLMGVSAAGRADESAHSIS